MSILEISKRNSPLRFSLYFVVRGRHPYVITHMLSMLQLHSIKPKKVCFIQEVMDASIYNSSVHNAHIYTYDVLYKCVCMKLQQHLLACGPPDDERHALGGQVDWGLDERGVLIYVPSLFHQFCLPSLPCVLQLCKVILRPPQPASSIHGRPGRGKLVGSTASARRNDQMKSSRASPPRRRRRPHGRPPAEPSAPRTCHPGTYVRPRSPAGRPARRGLGLVRGLELQRAWSCGRAHQRAGGGR